MCIFMSFSSLKYSLKILCIKDCVFVIYGSSLMVVVHAMNDVGINVNDDFWRRIMFGFEKARRPYFGDEWVAKKRVAKGGKNHTKKIRKRSQNLQWGSRGRRLARYSEPAQPHEPEPEGLLAIARLPSGQGRSSETGFCSGQCRKVNNVICMLGKCLFEAQCEGET
eukprot:TRINITY_DN14941_c0_g1_i1.p1 TRINITY_DN14941_c0_g1~~TRINITY_DN14941_c0_g1_i1.p1  ORF type:complete len:166 (-),score=20.87 TRINITY_DN14941_c0_g1_i1:204-701(-)